MSAFLIRWLITTAAVFVTANIVPGIHCDKFGALLGAALLLGIINAFIRPVLLLLSLPLIIVTMGLFIFVVNALLLMLVSSLVPEFHVAGFWSAFFGSIIISFISWVLSSIFRGSDGKIHSITHHVAMKKANAREVK